MDQSTPRTADQGRLDRVPSGNWHAADLCAVQEALRVGHAGLAEVEAKRRLSAFGPNRLPEGQRRSVPMRFLKQFDNLLIYVLIGAGVTSGAIGHLTDSIVIFVVVIMNAIIGFVQEGKAERALEAVRGMIDPTASVLREGRRVSIAADEVAPGDMVLLEAGDRVPADLRLVKARNLRIDEAILTGESVPTDKTTTPVATEAALGDRFCMAYSGTFVTAGQGVGVAVATGGSSELGRISSMLGGVEQLATPLVRQMSTFAKQVTAAVLIAAAFVFAFAVTLRDYSVAEGFMIVVGLAVAAIPEGLPTVMTIALAVGVQRMARRNAIVRRLPAVETLGSVSVICSDKTGTLTLNEMMAAAVVVARGTVSVTGAGYDPAGVFQDAGGAAVDPLNDPILAEVARAALLCNDAELHEVDGRWTVTGDPMEGALVSLALKAGLDLADAKAELPRRDEIPFDSRHRYMATLHRPATGDAVVYVKGAPERIIGMCDVIATAEGPRPLDRAAWEQAVHGLAEGGQRIIALARRTMPTGTADIGPADVEAGLVFLGLVGLIDPPRPEAVAAIAECRKAGIQVKMITGDHAATARAIAQELGLADDPRAATGEDLDRADGRRFGEIAREGTVFARTSPEHKLRLVEALQSTGKVVAMTGDGVNDAPALKRADVGVAMGRKGTEAAKEASEMVLADDNFASIVAAVREGRTVYDNLRKVISFLLPINGGESMVIVLAVLLGFALPVTPLQILWVNMVSSVALALALAFEPTEPATMQRPPRPSKEQLLSGRLLWRILFVTALIVAGTFGIYAWAIGRGLPVDLARTMAVNSIVVMEVFYLFSVRYVHGTSLTWRGVLGTPAVLLGIACVVVAQAAFTYAPPLQAVFGTQAVPLADGLAVVAVGVVLLIVVELEKRLAARWR
jgi:magnesium-transporting ATPase (P-type)